MRTEVVVDRIEGKQAVVETKKREQIIIPVRYLPEGTEVGDVLIINIEKDTNRTLQRRKKIKDLRERLLRRQDGVTFLEILVVVIIIGILAALSVPKFSLKIQKLRGERAKNNIECIAGALKEYYIRYEHAPDYNLLNTLSNINRYLKLQLRDSHFSYTITNSGTEAFINAQYNSQRWIQYRLDPTKGVPDEWDKENSNWDWW